MPIYEYKCRSCAHEFEFLVLASTTPGCPLCQSRELERLLSAFGVSSEATRQSNLIAAKRRLARSPDVRDKKIDEAEHTYEHTYENVDPKFRPPPPKFS
jgi:putative FmdB family regulatory protein